jgi:hypothetical protein
MPETFMKTAPKRRLPVFRLALLTASAILIHGYHLGVEDGEIYIPAAKKLLHPDLYPFGTEFFLSHERLSLFAPILAWTSRFAHLPMDWTVALWYVVTIFAMLLSCWVLAAVSFSSERARWSSLLLITAVLSMPAANTGLLLMDPYLTARSFSTPLTVLALAGLLQRRYLRATVWILLTAAVHPQMALYLFLLAGILETLQRWKVRERARSLTYVSLGFLPIGFQLAPAQPPYREALYARDFYFLSNWTWYHWLGLLAPLAILIWFRSSPLRGVTPEFRRLCLAMLPFGLVSIAVAALFSSSHSFDMFARLQPLRSFHLITLIFVLYLGGVIGEYTRSRKWLLPAILLPVAGGMTWVAWQTYPLSSHIEAPWMKSSSNAWVNTLLWVRENTPKDAIFAVDSRYFKDDGVDVHGFRAISERSDLADYFKDSGVVAIFPGLATEWKQMSDATYGLNKFNAENFAYLARKYPVTWTVIHGPAPAGMNCPYQQQGYSVCHISERVNAESTFQNQRVPALTAPKFSSSALLLFPGD